ncbi:hypothetical protein [Larsenimonas rhizosphaerae]|uniref:YfhG lipoprotein n=1 Tax=Larsenimonas rhizosphaerae TaxID=2944682 RepID=A0AA41ZCG4_9GAMM|nr:hypothetical protein [Larsenimonas rhizosphaerae]MCM2130030.1 hypothetical protein [Larsenimonas rhizosphaerae]MCX2522729.1 hypothetical protein [Larsenimonas rhizosphaerae]
MKLEHIICGLAVSLMLSGCQMITGHNQNLTGTGASNCFFSGPPVLIEGECLLPNWIAFGIRAQHGNDEWRRDILKQTGDDTPQDRLARAVVLSWGTRAEWKQATALYRTELDKAPVPLQPLLHYWLDELEYRKTLVSSATPTRDPRIQQLADKNAELTRKLDALTAIEESMNARRRSP